MRSIVLSALFAAGIGLAGVTGAAAAPASPVLNGAVPGLSLYTPAQVVIIEPRRHRRICRQVRRCFYNRYDRLVCRYHTVCRRRW